jgi:hypothetical protein
MIVHATKTKPSKRMAAGYIIQNQWTWMYASVTAV